ncbi:MAG: peptidase T [Acidobacteriota bacterium]
MSVTLTSDHQNSLLERFQRYVKIDTRSEEGKNSNPSTEKQKDLSLLLVDELKALGCSDAAMDERAYVFATVAANIPNDHPAHGCVPTIGLIAHVDTYPGTSGKDVKPQIIENYDGSDIHISADQVLEVSANPNLSLCKGHTLIHTDGTTLLGADDKAGIAEIMTLIAWLKDNPDFLHGTIRIGFTPDEEIGEGADHFDVAAFGADYAYTLDGSELGEIEDETFCADTATVTITGHDVHPGYAKDKMTNAVRVAAAIIESIDETRLPETTEGREPYLHAYQMSSSDVSKAEFKVLVRAFTEEELKEREDHLDDVVSEVGDCFPGAKIEVEIKESYRNMGYKINEDPKVLDYAIEGIKRAGVEPKRQAIRGGTDGARLSFMGLLTPNIWAGGQNFHSVNEWVSLEWMVQAVEATAEILGVWVEKS